MMKRRLALAGFNLLLATAILVQPGKAASACDFNACTCACLEVWDDCFEGGRKARKCDGRFSWCMIWTRCKPEIDIP